MEHLVDLRGLIKYGRGNLVPKVPVSLYRYLEHLIEVATLRKFKLQRILEIGPGSDSVFKYLGPHEYASGSIVDYHPKVLKFNQDTLKAHQIDYTELDVEDPNAFKKLEGRKWDFIVCNSILEHLKYDHEFVNRLRSVLADGGVVACSTVIHQKLFNEWDHAVGHYRRYSVKGLRELFSEYSQVEVIQTSLLQELVRPLFFSRIRHLLKNSVEENNRLFGEGHSDFGKPPYSGIFPVVRFLLPVYLLGDWLTHRFLGGIVFVVAKR